MRVYKKVFVDGVCRNTRSGKGRFKDYPTGSVNDGT